MHALREILQQNQHLLLFSVIGIGFLVGQLRLRGVRLGVAGVLFVGLLAGAWHPQGTAPLAVSHDVQALGLILFVYTVGLTSGPGFFAALGPRALRFNALIVAALLLGAVAAAGLGGWLGLPPEQIAGAYCGSLTNTPALAAVTELIHNAGHGAPTDATVGYSVTYPFGVIGGLLAFQLFVWALRRPFREEQDAAAAAAHGALALVNANFEIRNAELFGKAIGELRVQEQVGVILSRHRRGEQVTVPTKYTTLEEGDLVLAVGTARDVAAAERYFGARSNEHLELVQGRLAVRRILVSRKELAGRTIHDLQLDRRFHAQVTRVKRADIDMVARPAMRLEPGDRLRVVMPRERAAEVAAYFGDSERDVSEIDFAALTFGISAGVLLGLVPLPVPGGAAVALGFAGGPLVTGLILGKLARTGPLVWSLPHESNHALRHVGLLLFLAGVGVNAGQRFAPAFAGQGWQLLVVGAATTTLVAAAALLGLRVLGGASVISAIGATSGLQTQPATLAYAHDLSKSDETYVAYAITYPAAMVAKIIIAQLIVLFGNLVA